jgi:hypothetical protein
MNQEAEESTGVGIERRRRTRREGTVRSVRIAIAVDEAERDDLAEAAGDLGLTVSAFVADAALRAARGTNSTDVPGLREAVRELARAAVQVQRIGTNLNQAVAALNATGQATGDLVPCARYATSVIQRLDEVAARVAGLLP